MEGRICLIHKVRRNVGVEKCLDVAVNNGDVIQLMVGWRCMLISRSDSSLIHDFFLSITRDFCYKKFLLGDTLAEHRRVLSFHRQSMLLNVSFVVRPPLPVSSLNIRWLLVNAKVTVWLPGLIFFFFFFVKTMAQTCLRQKSNLPTPSSTGKMGPILQICTNQHICLYTLYTAWLLLQNAQ